MTPLPDLAVPKGSLVLVTGANGLLGSHIADQFLEHGYRVRGTVRDTEKNAWLQALFDQKHGGGNFELYKVADLQADGAFDEAVKGTSIVVHSASIMSFSPDPDAVIPPAVSFALNALRSAYKEASVRRFVLTSSSSAAVAPGGGPGPDFTVAEDSWNEAALAAAWAEPPYTEDRSGVVYAASKAASEQAVWKYHEENRGGRPDLVVNTVLPDLNFGRSLDPVHQGHPSSAGLPVALWHGKVLPFHHQVPPQYFIDVGDTGRLHVAAGILAHVKDERIFGFAGRFSMDDVLGILRRAAAPGGTRKIPDNFSAGSDPSEIAPRGRAEQLLRDLGRPGWVGLEESVLANIEDVRGS
ncbi:hypothetical protein KVR01_011906 [Diaporthe batatas]|uniref:uncharacterized protein n=1 Tax=Diaporthe batatas TaxID=748121 RepID=UPI001D048E71|nr:uncharacterized protein KVR01_011906 [Diaporthe batatas]KAG8158145.1 hypothetical protein KVR01_011906 [Diaporthe batatas]